MSFFMHFNLEVPAACCLTDTNVLSIQFSSAALKRLEALAWKLVKVEEALWHSGQRNGRFRGQPVGLSGAMLSPDSILGLVPYPLSPNRTNINQPC